MTFMPWKDEYSVGVQLFDDQHQKMFQFINDLNDAMMDVEEQAVLFAIIEGLIEYTKKHFKDEEDNLRRHCFSGLAEHEAEHQKLTKSVIDFSVENKNHDSSVTVKVMDFLYHWITDHILDSDKKYSEFLKGKEIIGDV
ncbi:MAG: hemerythrin family protein [Calditrichaeota bacterium]|nr:hemerythrin family protein [Calditrichota bacterium]